MVCGSSGTLFHVEKKDEDSAWILHIADLHQAIGRQSETIGHPRSLFLFICDATSSLTNTFRLIDDDNGKDRNARCSLNLNRFWYAHIIIARHFSWSRQCLGQRLVVGVVAFRLNGWECALATKCICQGFFIASNERTKAIRQKLKRIIRILLLINFQIKFVIFSLFFSFVKYRKCARRWCRTSFFSAFVLTWERRKSWCSKRNICNSVVDAYVHYSRMSRIN